MKNFSYFFYYPYFQGMHAVKARKLPAVSLHQALLHRCLSPPQGMLLCNNVPILFPPPPTWAFKKKFCFFNKHSVSSCNMKTRNWILVQGKMASANVVVGSFHKLHTFPHKVQTHESASVALFLGKKKLWGKYFIQIGLSAGKYLKCTTTLWQSGSSEKELFSFSSHCSAGVWKQPIFRLLSTGTFFSMLHMNSL